MRIPTARAAPESTPKMLHDARADEGSTDAVSTKPRAINRPTAASTRKMNCGGIECSRASLPKNPQSPQSTTTSAHIMAVVELILILLGTYSGQGTEVDRSNRKSTLGDIVRQKMFQS